MRILLISAILSFSLSCNCQDQNFADSVKLLIGDNQLLDTLFLRRLEEISFHENDPLKSERFADSLIRSAERINNSVFSSIGYLQKGNALRLQGNYEASLESFFIALKLAKNEKDQVFESQLYTSIADVYSVSGNETNAILYYNKSIEVLKQSKDTLSLAKAYLNKGDEFLNQGEYQFALNAFEQASPIFKSIGNREGMAYNLGNQGIAFAGLGKSIIAEEKLNAGISILEDLEDYYSISVYLNYLSELYFNKNDKKNALKYAHRSLALAKKYGLKAQISEASLQLSSLFNRAQEHDKAFIYYKDHIRFRDSVTNIETVEQLANMRTEYEVSEKQLEVDLLEVQKKNQRLTILAVVAGLCGMILFALGLHRRNKFIQETNKIIEAAKQKSEKLLLNILPSEIAEELKLYGKVTAKKHNKASVLFTDFVGFTKYAEHLNPDEVVEELDYYFNKFDSIVEKHGIEKIKTIGDGYMCAGGLHSTEENHIYKIIEVAKEIRDFVAKEKNTSSTGNKFDIRIGINTGPVVAGVVGHSKFAYDIWGDTVNLASRMESNSKLGQINISEFTYDSIKEKVPCEFHKNFVTRNGTKIKMYFVKD